MGEFLSLSFPGIFIGFVTSLFSGFFAMLVGAYVTRYLSGQYLLIATAALIFYSGARFLVPERRSKHAVPAPEKSEVAVRAIANQPVKYVATGLSAGFIGGLLGLGGGFLMIPLFVHWLKKGFGVLLMVSALYFAYAEFLKVLTAR